MAQGVVAITMRVVYLSSLPPPVSPYLPPSLPPSLPFTLSQSLFPRLDLVANYIRLEGQSSGIFQYTVTYE